MKFLKDNSILDIQEAKPENAEEILNLLKQIGSETDFLLLDETGLHKTLEEEKAFLEKANTSITTKFFIGLVNGKVVADCGIMGHHTKKTKHNVDLGISVLKDFWHKGVGRHMLEHTINYARITAEIKNIYLEVRADNLNAIKLYESLGFKKVGTMPDKVFSNGKYFDELIYLLQI